MAQLSNFFNSKKRAAADADTTQQIDALPLTTAEGDVIVIDNEPQADAPKKDKKKRNWKRILASVGMVFFLLVAIFTPLSSAGFGCSGNNDDASTTSASAPAGTELSGDDSDALGDGTAMGDDDMDAAMDNPYGGEGGPSDDESWDEYMDGYADDGAETPSDAAEAAAEDTANGTADTEVDPGAMTPVQPATPGGAQDHPTVAANTGNLTIALREALLVPTEPGPDATEEEKRAYEEVTKHQQQDAAADKADGTTDGTIAGSGAMNTPTREFMQALMRLVSKGLINVEALGPVQQDGGKATAKLGLRIFNKVPVKTDVDLEFVWANGRWQLAQSVSCKLVEAMGMECPGWLASINKNTAAAAEAETAGDDATATSAEVKSKQEPVRALRMFFRPTKN